MANIYMEDIRYGRLGIDAKSLKEISDSLILIPPLFGGGFQPHMGG